jgi:ABC-type Mn2+/Zn2+ transport system permease subunit
MEEGITGSVVAIIISVTILCLGSMLWSQFCAIFANFLRKKLAVSEETNVMIKFLQKLAVVGAKNLYIFAKSFVPR